MGSIGTGAGVNSNSGPGVAASALSLDGLSVGAVGSGGSGCCVAGSCAKPATALKLATAHTSTQALNRLASFADSRSMRSISLLFDYTVPVVSVSKDKRPQTE